MATFNDHIAQAKHNYEFCKFICKNSDNFYDWRVTVNFYIGIHLINAHLAYIDNVHYRRHSDVENAINPNNNGGCALPEEIYLSYKSLHNLSRRSRYLISEKMHNREEVIHHTSEKHYNKSKNRMIEIAEFFETKYHLSIIDKVAAE